MTTQEQAEKLAIDAVTKFTVPFDEVCVRVRKDIILSTIPLVELLVIADAHRETINFLKLHSAHPDYLDYNEQLLDILDSKLKGTK